MVPSVARLLAIVVALAVGATGAVPHFDGSRCVRTGEPMEPSDTCCASVDIPMLSIGEVCCETVSASRIDARASAPAHDSIAPAPYVGVLTFATPAHWRTAWDRSLVAVNRGSPPGDRIELFSSILRI
jgi:hypothetical protein